MRNNFRSVSLFLLIALCPLLLPGAGELPLHKKRLSDKVAVIYVGEYFQSIGVVALATEKGIVTIDSMMPESGRRSRKSSAGAISNTTSTPTTTMTIRQATRSMPIRRSSPTRTVRPV